MFNVPNQFIGFLLCFRGARHGLRLSGKLQRVEQQEDSFKNMYPKRGCSVQDMAPSSNAKGEVVMQSNNGRETMRNKRKRKCSGPADLKACLEENAVRPIDSVVNKCELEEFNVGNGEEPKKRKEKKKRKGEKTNSSPNNLQSTNGDGDSSNQIVQTKSGKSTSKDRHKDEDVVHVVQDDPLSSKKKKKKKKESYVD